VEKDRQSRLVQSEAGQAIIEFALTITLTLMLIFGLIEFSRAIYTASVIQWAAQKGARTAIVDSTTNDEVREAVKARLAGLDPAKVEIEIRPDDRSGSDVEVEVRYPFEFIVPLIMDDSIQMNANATMVKY
jgi:Flp pilus assembly protein TadG